MAGPRNRLKSVDVDKHGTVVTPYLLPEDYFHTGSYTDEEKDKITDGSAFEYRSDKTWGKVVDSRDQWLPFDGQGQAIVVYKDEMYALKEGMRDRSKVLSQWGISKPESHDECCSLSNRASRPSTGLAPRGASRRTRPARHWSPPTERPFLLRHGRWSSWRTFRRDRSSTRGASLRGKKPIPDEEIERLQARALDSKKKPKKPRGPKVTVEADPDEPSNTEGGEPEEEVVVTAGTGKHPGSGKDGATKTRHKLASGSGTKGITRATKLPPPPQPEFLDADEWEEKGWDMSQFVHVALNANTYEIFLNRGHRVYANQVNYFWTDTKYGHFSEPRRKTVYDKILRVSGGRTPGAKARAEVAVIDEIEYVYRHDTLAAFLGAMANYVDEKSVLDRMKFNSNITNGSMALTDGMSGLYPQQASIVSRLNSLAGSKR